MLWNFDNLTTIPLSCAVSATPATHVFSPRRFRKNTSSIRMNPTKVVGKGR